MKHILLIVIVASILFLTVANAAFGNNLDNYLDNYYQMDDGNNDVNNSFNFFTSAGQTAPTYQSGTALIGSAGAFTLDSVNISAGRATQLSDRRNNTMNMWINIASADSGDNIMGRASNNSGSPAPRWKMQYSAANTLKLDDLITGNPSAKIKLNTWIMVTIITNETGACWYLNTTEISCGSIGVDAKTGDFVIGDRAFGIGGAPVNEMYVDEVGFWYYDLSPAQVASLYNGGAGLPFTGALTNWKNVLKSPASGQLFDTGTVNLTANYSVSSASSFKIENVTYYLWNQTGLVNNTEFVELNGTYNSTTVEFKSLPQTNYIWNAFACYRNATFHNCSFATAGSNFTFNIVGFTTSKESWTNTTFEGNVDVISILANVTGTAQISTATLIYNNTRNTGTITNVGGNAFNITRSITAPDVSVRTNVTFYWEFLLDSGLLTNSTFRNQTVLPLGIDDCTAHSTIILNYSMWNEEDRKAINNTKDNSTIEVDVSIYPRGLQNKALNFSKSYNESDTGDYGNVLVCISENLTTEQYEMDSNVRYKSNNRAIEFHHIQNQTLNASLIPFNVKLFDLENSKATVFELLFKDDSFLPVENAIIDVTRYYVNEGLFRSVEVGKTDANGKTSVSLVENEVVYTFVVSKFGKVLATFNNVKAKCEDSTTGDCSISLKSFDSGTEIGDMKLYKGIAWDMKFNLATRTVTATFTTTNGAPATIELNTTKFDRLFNDTVCSTRLVSSTGTLNCVIPESYGNLTVISELFINGEKVTTGIYRIAQDISDWMEGNEIFFGLILILVLPLMAITSLVGMVIFLLIGLVMGVMLGIFSSPTLLGIGSFVTWAIIAGVIIIWKLNSTSNGAV